MTKPSKPTPDFASESDEHAFWESPENDSTNFIDWNEAKLATFPNLRPIPSIIPPKG